MKKTLTIFALLSFLCVNARYYEGTVYFKNNTTAEGFIKIRVFGGIKFKTNKQADAKLLDYNHIDGFDIEYKRYRYIKSQHNFPPKLLNQRILGKICLYSNQVTTPGHMVPSGFTGGGMSFGGGTATIYYLKINDKLIKIGTRFKKRHLKILSDCPGLIDKIENKEFHKRDILEIVKFYNKNAV